MAYRSTHEVVKRVMPLINQLATRTIDKARLVQYLSATAAVDWGVMEPAGERVDEAGRWLTFRGTTSGAEHELKYPDVLSDDLHDLVLAEYKRLAVDKPLTSMDRGLFDLLFKESHCLRCRYAGPEFEQFHRECHFAGYPINFEPVN